MRATTAIAGRTKLLLLLLLSFGCTSPEQRATAPANSAVTATRTAAEASKTDTVEIREMKFNPSLLTVAAGTKIVFINNDMVTHDITEAAKKSWSSGLLRPSKSWRMTANKSFDYFCSIHLVMKGKIVVR